MGIELTLEGITKKYGEVTAVNQLAFTVNNGELFALLGPSGAGKSTTINLIAGIEKPDTGDIRVGGKSIQELRPQERDFAMVFESYALYPHMTVADNMAFPLRAPTRATRYTAQEIRRRVDETAQVLEIGELLQRYPKELSGGQKQRVGLGRALVRDSQLFLLDEPIAHLDAKLRHHMRGELKRMQKKSGRTTVLATPDYAEVVAMADRAAVLNHGVIEQIGTPIELFNRPLNVVVAQAIGEPPINLLDCEVACRDGRLLLNGAGFSVACNDRLQALLQHLPAGMAVSLGIRPSEIAIHRDPAEGLIRGEVYVFEPLGGEAVATVSVQGKLVKVLCSWSSAFRIGEPVSLSFDLDTVHVFNRDTGKAFYA
ncbi:MAG: ABC transporter ATP-binding protein [Spirochaetia bacterium]|jgi:multiple sugar transport system ATP-binding protein